MLLIGSQKTDCDCDFPLHTFLIISGIIGLCLTFIDIVAPKIDEWIRQENNVTTVGYVIQKILRALAFFLLLVQVGALVGGSILIFKYYSVVSHDPIWKADECKPIDKLLPRPEGESRKYCDYTLYNFSFWLAISMWIFLTLGIACLLYIYIGLPKKSQNEK